MAQVVDEMPGPARNRRPVYPWDEWLDGRVWQLTPGEDFQAKVESFRQMAYLTAIKRGVRANVHFRDGFLFLQATDD